MFRARCSLAHEPTAEHIGGDARVVDVRKITDCHGLVWRRSARVGRVLDGPPAGGRPAGPAAHGPGGPAAADDVALPAQDRFRVTSSRSPSRRAFGITPSSAASRARSAQFSFGRCGCRRCRTASWWRRIKISAVFHVSSHRDSRSHAASRVIRRNTSRRHMIGDHHGRSAGRATQLVRAMDAILGTHSDKAADGALPNVTPPRGPQAAASLTWTDRGGRSSNTCRSSTAVTGCLAYAAQRQEHQQFGILGHLTPGQHHQAGEQIAHELVDARQDHSGMISARKTPPARPDRVIEPYRCWPARMLPPRAAQGRSSSLGRTSVTARAPQRRGPLPTPSCFRWQLQRPRNGMARRPMPSAAACRERTVICRPARAACAPAGTPPACLVRARGPPRGRGS